MNLLVPSPLIPSLRAASLSWASSVYEWTALESQSLWQRSASGVFWLHSVLLGSWKASSGTSVQTQASQYQPATSALKSSPDKEPHNHSCMLSQLWGAHCFAPLEACPASSQCEPGLAAKAISNCKSEYSCRREGGAASGAVAWISQWLPSLVGVRDHCAVLQHHSKPSVPTPPMTMNSLPNESLENSMFRKLLCACHCFLPVHFNSVHSDSTEQALLAFSKAGKPHKYHI